MSVRRIYRPLPGRLGLENSLKISVALSISSLADRTFGQMWLVPDHGRGCVSIMLYSVRSAVMGEMEAAKLAGIRAAIREQTARAPAANAKASGSQKETSYN